MGVGRDYGIPMAAILIKIIDEAFIFETKGDNVIG